MTDFAARFGELARGLLSLEINTIIKEGMSATPMGAPSDALMDIALAYTTWLNKHRPEATLTLSPADFKASYFTTLASEAAEQRTQDPPKANATILARIERNSRTLVELFAKVIQPDPEPGDLVRLKKIWEVGTEEVVMQTVMWLDGDATQRFHPHYADSKYAPLHDMHKAGVSLAIGYWKDLGAMMLGVLQAAWGRLKSP